MTAAAKRSISLTGLFASFVFLQFTILNLANHAGEGYLPMEQREQVYYIVQVFVILGFFPHAAARRLFEKNCVLKGVTAAVLAVFLAGGTVLFLSEGSRLQMIVTYATVFCLGFLGGVVFLRMSQATAAGMDTAWSLGLGSAAAVALQYPLQLRWGVTPPLPVFMLAAFVLMSRVLLREPAELRRSGPAETTLPRRIVFACLIAAMLVLFASFYNSYIHHLQVQSGYTDFNVYAWPRLIQIPSYLFFGLIGDRNQGRLVPVTALCLTLAALLNAVLAGNAGAYWLNMCLFYLALSGAVSYYDLTFWRLAPGTRHPALWAPMGRVIDSVLVLLSYGIHLGGLPAPAVLAVDVAGLALIIVLMAANGDFNFAAPEPVPAPADGEERLARLADRYGLSPAETKVLREMVLTEDKQSVIAETLSIRVSTVQHHTTAIYRKTGASTRAGLHLLYNDSAQGEETAP